MAAQHCSKNNTSCDRADHTTLTDWNRSCSIGYWVLSKIIQLVLNGGIVLIPRYEAKPHINNKEGIMPTYLLTRADGLLYPASSRICLLWKNFHTFPSLSHWFRLSEWVTWPIALILYMRLTWKLTNGDGWKCFKDTSAKFFYHFLRPLHSPKEDIWGRAWGQKIAWFGKWWTNNGHPHSWWMQT